MVNSAGDTNGNHAPSGFRPRTLTQIDLLKMVSTTALISPDKASDEGAARRQAFPQHGKQQHREVCARRDREGEADHEGDVQLFEQHAKDDRHEPEDQGRDPGNAHLRVLRRLALLEHAGVQVVADGAGAGQGQARNDRQDGRERDRRDEAQEQIAADGVREVDRRHVAAAQADPS